MKAVKVATWSEVPEQTPNGAALEGIDLVGIRHGDEHSVLYGRCLHARSGDPRARKLHELSHRAG